MFSNMNRIDISTEEKKLEVYNLFTSFNNKGDIHHYFGISDNSQGCSYIKEVANEIGFDLSSYKKKKYCVECGKELKTGQKKFCSKSCAASYNNRQRDKSVYEKVALKLTKKHNQTPNHIKADVKNKCLFCGQDIADNKKFCSDTCSKKQRHAEAYKDFLTNNAKYCKGNYTPKAFKNDILEEQDTKCAICGCTPEHNGKPLVFVLDHIDGDASNNKRENLRMVCPNCDSQLDTFKSKNKHSTRRNYWKENIIKSIK